MKKCRRCEILYTPRPWQIKKKDFLCTACYRANENMKYANRPRKRRNTPDNDRLYNQRPDRKTKARARLRAREAVKLGKIIKIACVVCGNEKSEMHHDDYSKPFDVIWLCRYHHKEHHKQLGFARGTASFARGQKPLALPYHA